MIDEAHVRASLVRITTASGEACGTGFVATMCGRVLTCHHVVADLEECVVHFDDGTTVTIAVAEQHLSIKDDLAILNTGQAVTDCLALGPSRFTPDSEYWGTGYGKSKGVSDALPVGGRVLGTTAIDYESGKSNYTLSNVLVLRDSPFNSGISGSPLIDPQTGVAVGVINAGAKQGGFAIPLAAHAVTAWAPLKEMLELNDRQITRYGHHLNRLGLLDLCNRQVQREAEALRRQSVFDSSKYRSRDALEHLWTRFHSQAKDKLCTIVGPSGSGKTSAIVGIAEQCRTRADQQTAVLLIQKSSIRHWTSLAEVVSRALRFDTALPDTRWEHVLECGLSESLQFTVVIEALNEPPEPVQVANGLFRELPTLDLPNELRFVLTCRPEFWELIRNRMPKQLNYLPDRPDRLHDRPSRDRTESLVVDPLTEGEVASICDAYGVQTDSMPPELRSLPVFIRLWSELTDPEHQVHPTEVDLLAHYILSKSRTVESKLSLPPDRAKQTLFRFARTLGAALQDGSTPELSSESAAHLDAFADEHVLLRSEAEYEFPFEIVFEYVLGAAYAAENKRMPLSQQIAKHLAFATWKIGRAVAFAIASIETASTEEARACINALIERVKQGDELSTIREIHIACDALSLFHDAMPFSEIIAGAMETFSERRSRMGYGPVYRMIGVARLTPELAFGLLRRIADLDDYYGWREKDWDNDSIVFYNSAGTMLRLVHRHREEAIQPLIQWLDDTRSLKGNEGSVASLAGGVLYRSRSMFFDALIESLVRLAPRSYLLQHVCRKEPERAAPILCRMSIEEPADALEGVFTGCYGAITAAEPKASPVEIQEAFVHLFERLSDNNLRFNAAYHLSYIASYVDTVKDYLIESAQSGHAKTPIYGLGGLLIHRFDEITDLLKKYIAAGSPQQIHEITWLFREFQGSGEQTVRVIAMISELVDQSADPVDIGSLVEHLLRRHFSPPRPLLDLAVKLAESAPERCTSYLAYYATSWDLDSSGDQNYCQESQDQVLGGLLRNRNAERARDIILGKCLEHAAFRDDWFAIAQKCSSHLSKSQFEAKLLLSAYQSTSLGLLVKAVQDDPSFCPGHLIAGFIDQIKDGVVGFEAIENALRDEMED